jgi:hypothetical protein
VKTSSAAYHRAVGDIEEASTQPLTEVGRSRRLSSKRNARIASGWRICEAVAELILYAPG